MDYTQFTPDQIDHMLATIGVKSIDELFSTIPADIRCRTPLAIAPGISEPEMLAEAQSLAKKNRSCSELTCFLGGGSYDHFVPTLVDALAMRSEFLTAYTPYQAEASQGTLQVFYEFQTMVCLLTGMEVANASLYEGATAAAEAVMMAAGITGRRRVLVAGAVHPDTLFVLRTYASERGFEIGTIPASDGMVDANALAAHLDDSFAALLVQSPNFFGCIERLDLIIPRARAVGAQAIVVTDPLACGVLKPPGTFDADIVVGEGQPLGIPMQYGGPYLGLLACRAAYLRKMPGRVVGMTTDRDGRRGFCLALQAREQHIRREKATSNVCTNQGLLATRAAVYMAAMGRQGIRRVAQMCLDKAHYAAAQIGRLKGYTLCFSSPFFKEFAIRTQRNVESVLAHCRSRGILAGVPLGRFDEQMTDCFLVAVTEKRTKAQIDALVDALESA